MNVRMLVMFLSVLRLEAFRNGLATLLTMMRGAVDDNRPESRHECGDH